MRYYEPLSFDKVINIEKKYHSYVYTEYRNV